MPALDSFYFLDKLTPGVYHPNTDEIRGKLSLEPLTVLVTYIDANDKGKSKLV